MSDQILALGLMSGTSMDAMDAVLVAIHPNKDKHILHLQKRYPEKLAKIIARTIDDPRANLSQLGELDYLIGKAFASTANQCIHLAQKNFGIPASEIDIIGSHGQTVFHAPKQHVSLQLGLGQVIAHETGITTVNNFRIADIVAGGEGAPLLPFYHQRFLRGLQKNPKGISIHNLGGISNFTYFHGSDTLFSLDTGPANCWMDLAMQILTKQKKSFDTSGIWASRGEVQARWLQWLRQDPAIRAFMKKNPPKSTGRELFNRDRLEKFIRRTKTVARNPQAILATLNQFSADLIIDAYQRFVLRKKLPLNEIIFCGGGSKNKNLLQRIGRGLPGVKISILDEYGLPSQTLEAQAFACFAVMTVLGIPQSIPSATGAPNAILGGQIIPASNWPRLYQKIHNIQWDRF